MRLLVDAGNTRIKWALTQGDEWLQRGALPTGRVAELSAQFADVASIREVWVSNVAGAAVAQTLQAAIAVDAWHSIVVRERQCGVSNGYDQPAQLGCDRWAALIAAWNMVGERCLVVSCGTATTIDALSETGEFMGGLILPGIELMQRSLCDATAQLVAGQGKYEAFPRNTADAMFGGAVQATCGAIERQYELLGGGHTSVVLGGGAVGLLRGRLKLPLRQEDDLVLQGLWLIARETKA